MLCINKRLYRCGWPDWPYRRHRLTGRERVYWSNRSDRLDWPNWPDWRHWFTGRKRSYWPNRSDRPDRSYRCNWRHWCDRSWRPAEFTDLGE